jgi:hypothetical protein
MGLDPVDQIDNAGMRVQQTGQEFAAAPVSDYSAAIANAVAWLGDRYLLAKPVNAIPAARTGSVRVRIFRDR